MTGFSRRIGVRPWQLLVALGANVVLGTLAPDARAGEAAYEIDTIVPLTGGAAFVGKSMQDTMQLSEKTLNKAGGIGGRPLHLVFHHDQSKPQVAVQLANAPVAKRPAGIFAPPPTPQCKP